MYTRGRKSWAPSWNPAYQEPGEKLRASEQETLLIGVVKEGLLGKQGADMDSEGWVGL